MTRTPQWRLMRYRRLTEIMPEEFPEVRDVVRMMAYRGRLDDYKRQLQRDEWNERQAARKARGIKEARRIPAAVQREVLADGLCIYCDVAKATVVDHIIPVSRGGTRRRRNLAPACEGCNDEKGDFTPAEWREWRLAHGGWWPPISRKDARRLYYGLLDMMIPESRSMVREATDRLILQIEAGGVTMAELSEPLDPQLAKYIAADAA